MLDVLNQNRLTLHEVAQKCSVNLATAWRWALRGIIAPGGERVRLETVRVGGRRVATEISLQTFLERINISEEAQTAIRTPNQRRALSERAGAQIEAAFARGKRGRPNKRKLVAAS